MRKNLLFALAIGFLYACSSDKVEEPQNHDDLVEVKLNLKGFTFETEAMTRATTAVGDYVTHLDIWLYESGNEFTSFHQTSSESGFGTLSLTLNNTKTYILYAVAHRCNSAASLSDAVISFPEDKVTHSFFIKQTFTPTKGMSLNLTMNRIVAQFSFVTTDAVPDWCKTLRFTISDVYDRWNVNTGGTHQLNRVSTINISSTREDGSVTCNVYAIVTNENTNHNILVEAIDANGEVQESHQFTNIPLKNNRRTIATGAFFTDADSGFSFLAQDWEEETTVNF